MWLERVKERTEKKYELNVTLPQGLKWAHVSVKKLKINVFFQKVALQVRLLQTIKKMKMPYKWFKGVMLQF